MPIALAAEEQAMARKRKTAFATHTAPEKFVPEDHFVVELSEPMLRNLLWWCIGLNCVLVLCDLSLNYGQMVESAQLRRLFNMAREDSIANWISSIQTLSVSLALCFVTVLTWKSQRPVWETRTWALFTGFFLFLAADDGAKIHERIGPAARDLAAQSNSGLMTWFSTLFDRVGGYSWHTAVLPLFVLFGIGLMVFGWKMFRQQSLRWTLFGALCLLALAVGLDYFEGWFRNVPGDVFHGWERYTISHFQKTFEEFIEMSASCTLSYVFAVHSLNLFHSVEFHAKTPQD